MYICINECTYIHNEFVYVRTCIHVVYASACPYVTTCMHTYILVAVCIHSTYMDINICKWLQWIETLDNISTTHPFITTNLYTYIRIILVIFIPSRVTQLNYINLMIIHWLILGAQDTHRSCSVASLLAHNIKAMSHQWLVYRRVTLYLLPLQRFHIVSKIIVILTFYST